MIWGTVFTYSITEFKMAEHKLMKSLDQLLSSCQERTVWHEGNQVLYDLCQKFPDHKDPGQIVAKTWLIGRAYSVALERRKGAAESNEVYYREKIPPIFMNSELDEWLLPLPKDNCLTESLLHDALEVHANLVSYLRYNLDNHSGERGLNRASFCSKYLHFHRPLLFPLYDTRAVRGLRILLKEYMPDMLVKLAYPASYEPFAKTVFRVLDKLNAQLSIPLDLRHVDNLLLQLGAIDTDLHRQP